MKKREIPPELLEKLAKITSKRPRTVIEHILKHGFITTEELESKYGYAHAPRAARDVREQGIPLETFRVKGGSGRSIAAYKFGDLSKIVDDKLGGRRIFSKEFKNLLITKSGSRCYICLGQFEERYLQVDHRIPYEVASDKDAHNRNVDDYMLVCGSCNRSKSWSCEHCDNWKNKKRPDICKNCYWVFPEKYTHMAENKLRRLELIWIGKETRDYEIFKKLVKEKNMPGYVKEVLKRHVENLRNL